MPRRLSEAVVTEFLRDALAVDIVGVPKLEAMARTAGLLGEGQRITHAKVFKKAKKSLGIRSTYLVVFTIVFGAAICFSIVSFIMGHTKRHSGTGRL